MTRDKYSLLKKAILATALCAGLAGIASADDGVGRFSDSYAYFSNQAIENSPSAWRRAHPNGVATQDLQALSSSNLSAFELKVNPPVFATAAADPSWRQKHPNGVTAQDLQALSSSNLSVFESKVNPPVFASTAADPSWRQTHPNGLTEQELVALSSNSVSRWQNPDVPGASAPSYLARSSGITNARRYQ